MKLKMVITCGMLLGLLSGVGYAQRMRLGAGAAHSTVPGARMPIAVPMDHIGNAGAVNSTPAAKSTTAKPSSVKSTAPAAETRPSAESDPAATTVRPSTGTVPDRTTVPTNTVDGRASAGPIQ
jgi:hypothetical protein